MDFFDPNNQQDSSASSLMNDLGQKAELEGLLVELRESLLALPDDTPAIERSRIELNIARALQQLERGHEAWPVARAAFDIFVAHSDWENAADACDILYQCEQSDSLVALGNGIWLSVTFPIDPEITINMLAHVIDDTPDDSDGAAVAAATALYIADMRTEPGPDRDRLHFFASQLLGKVARRHSEVETQEQFDFWVEKLELNDPDKFLIRLRNVVDVLAQEDWWIDRDEIRNNMPEN
ncbi:MAG: hypothetical protein PVG66_05290 [Chromatiales bacterium]|jgi:hypothetical protein